MLLLTKAGGHGKWSRELIPYTFAPNVVHFIANTFLLILVGWPLGLNPAANSWKWMSDSVRDFALAVDESIRSMK